MLNSIGDVANHPQIKHRHMIVDLPHPKAEKVSVPGNPLKMSRTPAVYKSAPPLLGQHTEDILEKLGYSQKDCHALKNAGVI